MVNNSFIKRLSIVIACFSASCTSASQDSTNTVEVPQASAAFDTKLLQIDDLKFAGAFALSSETFGESSANWSNGVIHVEGDRFYMTGHNHHDNIAEFALPPLTTGKRIKDLKVADQVRQDFTPTFTSSRFKNPEKHDYITGLFEHNGSLIVNSFEYYDAPADNRLTTFVVQDSANLEKSDIMGLHSLQGAARAAGWISKIPQDWQPLLKGTHISGNSSGLPIIARLSVGPSAFVFDADSLVSKSKPGSIKTKEVLGFTLKKPLHKDLYNESGQNNIWTHLSDVRYGFIVPGTATYMTVGVSGGHISGVGYKPIQDDGFECPGYCSNAASDLHNYYWLWDVRDMVRVREGKLSPHEVKPYSYGRLDFPSWITEKNDPSHGYIKTIRVGGASYDENKNMLYVSLLNKQYARSGSENPPIVVGFEVGK